MRHGWSNKPLEAIGGKGRPPLARPLVGHRQAAFERPFEGDWSKMLYMIVEHFKNKDAVPVYRRFRDRGRLAPEGLTYVSSWVDEKIERCFQLMETGDQALLERWMGNWSDIVEFEVYPVITSKEAVEKISPRL